MGVGVGVGVGVIDLLIFCLLSDLSKILLTHLMYI